MIAVGFGERTCPQAHPGKFAAHRKRQQSVLSRQAIGADAAHDRGSDWPRPRRRGRPCRRWILEKRIGSGSKYPTLCEHYRRVPGLTHCGSQGCPHSSKFYGVVRGVQPEWQVTSRLLAWYPLRRTAMLESLPGLLILMVPIGERHPPFDAVERRVRPRACRERNDSFGLRCRGKLRPFRPNLSSCRCRGNSLLTALYRADVTEDQKPRGRMIEALVEPKTSCLVALCVFRAVHSDIK